MRVSVILVALLIGVVADVPAQPANYKGQSLFIYNFIKYSNWPSIEGAFTIVVFGNSPILDELQQLASIKKTPEGKTIVVKQTSQVQDIKDCQILYVAGDKVKELQGAAEATKDRPVLIVSARDGLTKKGAAIGFFVQDDDRLSFELSRKNLQTRNIKVSGELMRLASLVD